MSSFSQLVDPDSPIMEQLDRVFMEQAAGTRLFIDAILNNQPVMPSFYEGLKAQAVIAAAMEAARRECWVSVEYGSEARGQPNNAQTATV